MNYKNFRFMSFLLIGGFLLVCFNNCGGGLSSQGSNNSPPTGGPGTVPENILTSPLGPQWIHPIDMAYKDERGILYVADAGFRTLFEVDLLTGNRKIVSGNGTGQGPIWDTPSLIEVGPVDSELLVFDRASRSLFKVNTLTGHRMLVSDSSTGQGPEFQDVRQLKVDSVNNRAYLLDRGSDSVLVVDLANGNRAEVSGKNIGTGAAMTLPSDLALDISSGVAYVSDRNRLLRINLANGNRTLLSDNSTGTGPSVRFGEFDFDKTNSRIIAWDRISGVIAVDLISGDRTALSPGFQIDIRWTRITLVNNGSQLAVISPIERSPVLFDLDGKNLTLVSEIGLGDGPRISNLGHLWLHPSGQEAIVSSSSYDNPPGSNNIRLLRVNLTTGNRQVLSGDSVGSGPQLGTNISDIAVSDDLQKIYVASTLTNTLFEVDMNSGNRRVISDQDTGTGPLFVRAARLTLSEDGAFAYIAGDSTPEIFEVNLQDGGRRIVTGRNVGSGASLDQIRSLVKDPRNPSNLLVASYISTQQGSQGKVVSVNTTSGARSLVSSNNLGNGPDVINPRQIHEKDSNTLYLLDGPGYSNLYEVNLQTGDRTLLGSFNDRSGIRFNYLWGLEPTGDGNFIMFDFILGTIFESTPDGKLIELISY